MRPQLNSTKFRLKRLKRNYRVIRKIFLYITLLPFKADPKQVVPVQAVQKIQDQARY